MSKCKGLKTTLIGIILEIINWALTIEYVYDCVCGKRVARRTSIVARVSTRCTFDVQGAVFVRQVRRHVNAPVDIIVNHPAVMIPEYIYRIHRTLSNHTFQMQRAVKHQVLLWSTSYLGLCLCEKKQIYIIWKYESCNICRKLK